MIKNIFSFDISKNTLTTEIKEAGYELASIEFGKPANSYTITQELYSNEFWEVLKKTYGVVENNMIVHTRIELDEKQKTHKTFKYFIKLIINQNDYFYISFYDEIRGYDDSDYREFATDNDKKNKISGIEIYYNQDTISFEKMEEITSDLIKYSYTPSNKNQFFTIQSGPMGFQLKSSHVKDLDFDLEMNYGTKFVSISKNILDKLKNTKHGLFIFHGPPGTGKTSYLRKIISELSDEKTIIYIPTYMMGKIADPELITFISQYKDTILILEDGENILANTIDNRSQAVSNILNMTDGLLNDSMEIQIIATFNTKKKLIDSALIRAGRLQVDYKFNKLSKENSQKLIDKLNLEKIATKPMSLAEIYEGHNQIIEDDLNNEKSVGFE